MNITLTSGTVAQISGWLQFGLALINQFVTAGVPHGVTSWLTLLGSLLIGVGVHAAASATPAPAAPVAPAVKL
jgi:hypothetical protein